MIKICVVLILSAPFALYGMDRTLPEAVGARVLNVVDRKGIETTEPTDGAGVIMVRPQDILEAHKAEIRHTLPAIRAGLLTNTLGSVNLGLNPFDDDFASEAMAIVVAEELFSDEQFTCDVLKWVDEYLCKDTPTVDEEKMAANVCRLIHFAWLGASEYHVSLRTDRICGAYRLLYATELEEISEDERLGRMNPKKVASPCEVGCPLDDRSSRMPHFLREYINKADVIAYELP